MQPGAIVWNLDIASDKVFIKCKDQTWLSFDEIFLPKLGLLTVPKLIQKLFKKKKAKVSVQTDGTLVHKFNFI